MMNENDIVKHLREKEVYGLVNSIEIHGIQIFVVSIEWGDWKHEHGYCDYIMQELGFEKLTEKVTESDGSDCYSADHYYRRTLKQYI